MKHTSLMIVGGTFDYSGGKPSSVVTTMINTLQGCCADLTYYNGGFVDELHQQILPQVKNMDIVVWMPNVPNDIPKMRNVKEINPKVILVSSKRNADSSRVRKPRTAQPCGLKPQGLSWWG